MVRALTLPVPQRPLRYQAMLIHVCGCTLVYAESALNNTKSLFSGVRLVCFCRRHAPSARYHPELMPNLRTTPAAAALAHPPSAPMLQQAAGREADGTLPEQLCSRTAPFNHALRRCGCCGALG